MNAFKILYPATCRSCQTFIPESHVFCDLCAKKIVPIVSKFISVTQKYAITVFAMSDYQEPLRTLILKKTHQDRLASRQLANLMYNQGLLSNMEFDYIIPIPLHWTRYASRGFNQAYGMAQVLSKKMNIPVCNILKRTSRTIPQSNLSYNLRQENVKNVFAIRWRYRNSYKTLLKDKRLLFVDDLCTTGATLRNAAHPLLAANPQTLSAAVSCRVI